MNLNKLYLIAKNLKSIDGFCQENMEVIYYIDHVMHEFLQQECYVKIKNTLTGYQTKKIFEISLFDIKFIFKQLPG